MPVFISINCFAVFSSKGQNVNPSPPPQHFLHWCRAYMIYVIQCDTTDERGKGGGHEPPLFPDPCHHILLFRANGILYNILILDRILKIVSVAFFRLPRMDFWKSNKPFTKLVLPRLKFDGPEGKIVVVHGCWRQKI